MATVLPCGLVILAAGASTRMGRPKQLLVVEGRTLLARTVEAALATPVWPVVVVLGAQAVQIRPAIATYPVLVAENPAWSEGMAASIRTGLATLQSFSRSIEAVLFSLCDQPALDASAFTRLLAASAAEPRGVIAARYECHPGPPALFTAAYFPALAKLSGDEGARPLIARAAAAGDLGLVDMPELARDLDTPEDYARLTNRTG